MELFVEIIDPSKVRSNNNLSVGGIPANRTEWNKHSFFPNKGVVGIVIGDAYGYDGKFLLVQCGSRIIVPILCDGVKEINAVEYETRLPNNTVVGKASPEQMNGSFNIDEMMDSLGKMFGW